MGEKRFFTKAKDFQENDAVEDIFVRGVGRTCRKNAYWSLFDVSAHQLFGWQIQGAEEGGAYGMFVEENYSQFL